MDYNNSLNAAQHFEFLFSLINTVSFAIMLVSVVILRWNPFSKPWDSIGLPNNLPGESTLAKRGNNQLKRQKSSKNDDQFYGLIL